MLTSLAAAPARDDRPAYRPFAVTVARVTVLGPHFTRVTVTGDDLHVFGTDGLDQRIKLLFPLPGGHLADLGADDPASHLTNDWYTRWRALPEAERNPLRTYTVRAVRPEARELDIDFAVHDTSGPAMAWLAGAAAGSRLLVVGPDARSVHSHLGIDFRPGVATRVLLCGDETAVPAIAAILESLDARVRATVLLETADEADALPMRTRAHCERVWLARDPAFRGARLHVALTTWLDAHPDVVAEAAAPVRQVVEDVDVDRELLWESPERGADGFYAWLAGEAATIKRLRRLLVTERGIDRKRVAFMGYWREGRAEES
ncbi:siderophore-interacting protein [Jatrophihabitans fulvus]